MTCRCGRERATDGDLERFRATVPTDHLYSMAPMTWQQVRLGVCLPPDESHLDIPADLLVPCWSITGRCMLPTTALGNPPAPGGPR